MAADPNRPFISLIMAGGSGTRFWPLSTKSTPKQYLKLFGERSLIQSTVDRLLPLQSESEIFVCSGQSQRPLLNQQLPTIKNLILEPIPRNTAPCLMLSVKELLARGFSENTVMAVFPADHHIPNGDAFRATIQTAVNFAAENDALITLGIRPTSPHTGYGYIQTENKSEGTIVRAKRFIEKPPLEQAKEFVRNGSYYWNGGIFIWSIRSIQLAFETFMRSEWTKILSAKTESDIERVFPTLAPQPIDLAVMEKATNVFLIGAENLGWSDVGSWNAVYELRAKDSSNSSHISIEGIIESVDSSGCLVYVQGKVVALVGVKDLIVVESNGKILITAREKDQAVRLVAERHPS